MHDIQKTSKKRISIKIWHMTYKIILTSGLKEVAPDNLSI